MIRSARIFTQDATPRDGYAVIVPSKAPLLNPSPQLKKALAVGVFFTWWMRAQRHVETWSPSRRRTFFIAFALIGVSARFWAQAQPPNWDFGQWVNVSTAALAGQDPYSTYGYNYPPPWLGILTALNWATDSNESFRLLIALLLAAVDLGIALILVQRGYSLAAWIYLLSPIAITISGQHQQVEGIAIFLAFAGLALISTSDSLNLTKIDWLAALLLGLSLSFKPIFLVLPLWLLMWKTSWPRRLVLAGMPFVVFGVALASAFVLYPPAEVLRRVLGHNSMNDSPFINTFVPQQATSWALEIGAGKVVFVVILIGLGYFLRTLPAFELGLAYTLAAVLFSWAVANQYLVTPMAAVAIYLNLGFLIWFGLVSLYFAGAPGILNLPGFREIQPHLLLEYNVVMQDFFPWLLVGWLTYVVAIQRPNLVYVPAKTGTGSHKAHKNSGSENHGHL